METPEIFRHLGISLLLGMLVGLQRQHSDTGLAGMRTFALITVFGTLSSLLSQHFASAWIIAAAFLGVIAVIGIGNFAHARVDEPYRGTTTEMAVLVMFMVGAYLPVGPQVVAVAVGAGTAVLLQFKGELHGFAHRLGDQDLRAVMQFVLITCIVLPVLPHQQYGIPGMPWSFVLSPYEIWLMVVLIVGVSLFGYILYKFVGRSAGVLLAGLVGGAVSSTATTVSYSRQASGRNDAAPAAAIAIMVASTVVHVRVLLEISIVSRELLLAAVLPVLVMMLASLLPALLLWLFFRDDPGHMPEQGNPAQLTSAIVFGLMYAVVLFALAAAKQFFSSEGLYVVAALSGLTDMDSITLSTARMVDAQQVAAEQGWRLIVIGIMSNLVFKGGIVGLLGPSRLLRLTVLLFAVPLAAGAALLAIWPT